MGNTEIRSEELKFQGLLDRFLNQRVINDTAPRDSHLDEDSLAAFVEGNLSERESGSVISHLIDCGFCLNVTSELTRLSDAFGDEPLRRAQPESQPSKVSEVLSGLLSRIFGSEEAVVFAHEEKDEDGSGEPSVDEEEK